MERKVVFWHSLPVSTLMQNHKWKKKPSTQYVYYADPNDDRSSVTENSCCVCFAHRVLLKRDKQHQVQVISTSSRLLYFKSHNLRTSRQHVLIVRRIMDQQSHICVSIFSIKEECLPELMKIADATSPPDIINATEGVNRINPSLARPEDKKSRVQLLPCTPYSMSQPYVINV